MLSPVAITLNDMKPNTQWIEDWKIGLKNSREYKIAKELMEYFGDFWDKEKLEHKSKTTKNRYSNSLHALGGYLVTQSISREDLYKSAYELLFEYVNPYEGPLIYHDNEDWQEELDMVCRNFYKYMTKLC